MQQLLVNQVSQITRDDLSFLWNKGGRIGNEFQTRAYDATCRLEYLDELISKYGALNVGKTMQKCVVRLSTSQDFLLTQEELLFDHDITDGTVASSIAYPKPFPVYG